ncbi:MAG TPA: hypothetical protein VFU51_03975 [Gaiellaceae bacterium]|nr:hypothetical protein [Gaiellaceae bacterium]
MRGRVARMRRAGDEHDPAGRGDDSDGRRGQRQQARTMSPAAGSPLTTAHTFEPAPLAFQVGRGRPLFVHPSLYVVVGPSVTVRPPR